MRRREPGTDRPGYRVPLRHTLTAPVVLALATVAARLPFVARPLSPDEGGFLMLAAQWSPGSSLYGDYWVDRPPLLIGLFGLAGHLGGAVGLRALGIVAVGAAVLLAGAVGRVAAPERRWAPALTAATAAVFLTTPLFGTREVNGELLATPFVLGGLLAVLLALREERRVPVRWAVAGALATCAVAVKQNMAEVAVAGLVVLLWQARARGLRRTAYDALAALGGALAVLVVLVVWAEARGTEPRALWDAAVTFRFEAASVISTDDPHNTSRRLDSMLDAFVRSGAPVVLLLPLLPAPRARLRGCLPLLAAAVCAWEAVGIAAGGSYWWHYQIGLVPGLVLVAAALARHRPVLQASLVGVLLYALLVGVHVDQMYPGLTSAQRVGDRAARFLDERAKPGDTGVVAFGTASILQRAGLDSPYEYLWSLPVRVRDSHLTELAAVLRASDHPTWVVVPGPSLHTWGVEPGRAQRELDRRYRLVGVVGKYHFFRAVDAPPPAVAR